MNQLGMLVDVSHLSDPGFWDVAEVCKGPFVASHSNARAVFSVPRNLTDGQFTAIIEHHGVAGLNMFAGFLGEDPDYDTVISHLEHFLSLGGEKSVAIGGDWDGISKMPRECPAFRTWRSCMSGSCGAIIRKRWCAMCSSII